MSYDVAALRAQFPSLARGMAHLDSPGGTQVPAPVAQAVAAAMVSPISNRGRLTASERTADARGARSRRGGGHSIRRPRQEGPHG